MQPDGLSVVMPARNEAGAIGATLRSLGAALRRAGIAYEILVVDDGSSDGTRDIVLDAASADPSVRLEVNGGTNGFGHAVRLGLERATGDNIVITMADQCDDPEDVLRYYHILRDEADCAFGSRWIHGGRVVGYPRFKRVLNRIVNHGIRLLFLIRYDDTTNAFKGYRRSVVERCSPLLASQFSLTVELPLKAIVRGHSYRIVPISWTERRSGRSSFSVRRLGGPYIRMIFAVWLERLRQRPQYRPQQ